MGLMAAGEVDHPAVTNGIAYLASTQGQDGFWGEERFTATGFPRVFYLRYHGYAKFFPMWALARYRNLKAANTKSVLVGMYAGAVRGFGDRRDRACCGSANCGAF